MKILAALAFAAIALCACSPLRADAPLFSTSDQIGPPALTEGVWVSIDDDCPASLARRHGRLSSKCDAMRLRRLPDGAWQIEPLAPPQNAEDAEHNKPVRFLLAPATEHPSADAYSPLYVAEYRDPDDDALNRVGYAAIAPIGTLPATELFFTSVDCAQILRDGPIAGVNEERDPGDNHVTGCTAANQTAVREATRRSLIESLAHVDDSRLIFVRP